MQLPKIPKLKKDAWKYILFPKKRNNDVESSHDDLPELDYQPEQSDADGHAEDTFCQQDQPIPGLSEIYTPKKTEQKTTSCKTQQQPRTKQAEPDIADMLLDIGSITTEQYAQLRTQQDENPDNDIETLILNAQLFDNKADDLLKAKAKLHGMEFQHIKPDNIDEKALSKLDIDFVKSSCIVPLAIEQQTLVVATCEPTNVLALEDAKRKAQMDLRVVVCTPEDIETVCSSFEKEELEYCFDDIISDMGELEVVTEKKENSEDIEKMAGQSPVIKFVNYLITNAIHEGASDIHIEPKDRFTKVRYRIDGILFETTQAPSKMHPALVSRIKIMSNLDISETRVPQDGKISVIVGQRTIDLRVSTLPTSHGEKVVIRVLDSKSILRGLEQLGMEHGTMVTFGEQIALPHGILLVTGPTGSGKSTTLYSAISQMDGEKLNISTVEDPVEYKLGFCNQVQVNIKAGLTFASALRSLLRQDPDIIMIGEIRDSETAKIAVQAALTGHLVLSTLHTNDAPSSITRLVNIGIDAYLIAASLNAVLAQRLVRRICPKCKELYKAPESMQGYVEKAGLEHEEFFQGRGCDYCRGSGYLGRAGIYELLVIDEKYRDMINKDSSVTNMRKTFAQSSQPTLFDDGICKVKQGLTTLEEVLRVTEISGQDEEEFVENIAPEIM